MSDETENETRKPAADADEIDAEENEAAADAAAESDEGAEDAARDVGLSAKGEADAEEAEADAEADTDDATDADADADAEADADAGAEADADESAKADAEADAGAVADADAKADADSGDDASKKKKRKKKKAKGSSASGKGTGAGMGKSAASGSDASSDSSDSDASDSDASDAKPSSSKSTDVWAPVPKQQRIRGAAIFAVGLLGTFGLMANSEQIAHGSLLGLATVLLATYGLLELLGLIRDDPDALPWRSTVLGRLEDEPVWAQPMVTGPLAAAILLIGGIAGGYETLPWVIAAALATLIPPAFRRPGLLVFVVVGLMYLPLLGTFGLWDPWETHYGEVAREIVARDDWISLWWAQENWFWSKPILIFWSEAFTFSALNLEVMPDANPAHPEWAVRLPVTLFSIAAVMTVYGTIRKLFTPRAGVLAALVLATMPHFFFLSHQAITDMYLVSNLVMAVCMLMLAFATSKDTEVKNYKLFFGRAWSGQTIVIGAIVVLALPQAMYLITRNIEFIPWEGFRIHPDTFLYGSAGNPGGLGAGEVPGNPAHRDQAAAVEAIQPALQGLFWLLCLGGFLWMMRRVRRAQSLYMTAFYAFCALAFMGKGIPGFALPGLVALFYLVASRRWNVLFDGQLRIAPGALVVACVGFPWYIAMYMRHGPGFTDRLLVHDHINRLAQGVHGDTGSIQYFIWQLGYATFPWVALIPAAALAWVWLKRGRSSDVAGPYRGSINQGENHQRQTMMLIGIWFFSAFTLFSAMITKFHHYIFPAVPPAAMLVGIFLDRLWGKADGDKRTHLLATAATVFSAVPLTLGIGNLWGGIRGFVPEDLSASEREDWILDHGWPASVSSVLIFAGAMLFAWGALWLWRNRAGRDEKVTALAARTELSLSVAVGAGAVLVAFVGRDLSWITSARPHGFERLIHLFVYNYGRPWPQEYDYRPILTGIAVVAGLLFVLATLRWTRAAAARALVGLSILFASWTLNVYMVDLAPHWGMRELFKAYYDNRSSPEEPVIAWQMNWKGENFYTGNRVFAFVDLDNAKLREWMGNNRGKTAFFVFEHSRLGSFRNLMRGRDIEEITDKWVCNKFMVVRVRSL
ncbi:MAG: glycosyltransferase family 39 protein [Myxococcota bacterium]